MYIFLSVLLFMFNVFSHETHDINLPKEHTDAYIYHEAIVEKPTYLPDTPHYQVIKIETQKALFTSEQIHTIISEKIENGVQFIKTETWKTSNPSYFTKLNVTVMTMLAMTCYIYLTNKKLHDQHWIKTNYRNNHIGRFTEENTKDNKLYLSKSERISDYPCYQYQVPFGNVDSSKSIFFYTKEQKGGYIEFNNSLYRSQEELKDFLKSVKEIAQKDHCHYIDASPDYYVIDELSSLSIKAVLQKFGFVERKGLIFNTWRLEL